MLEQISESVSSRLSSSMRRLHIRLINTSVLKSEFNGEISSTDLNSFQNQLETIICSQLRQTFGKVPATVSSGRYEKTLPHIFGGRSSSWVRWFIPCKTNIGAILLSTYKNIYLRDKMAIAKKTGSQFQTFKMFQNFYVKIILRILIVIR